MKNKTLSFVITLAMILAMFPMSAFAGTESDPVVTETANYDVFISADNSLGYDSAVLKNKISDKLTAMMVSGGGIQDARLEAKTAIDTTNLSGWYVYDHYNDEYWSNNANWPSGSTSQTDAWQKYYNLTTTTAITRPASFLTDTYATSASYNTIEAMVAANAGFGFAQRLREHIYSFKDGSGNAGMWFSGYGTNSRADFLFYPTSSTGSKNVKFTVNSSYVDTHSLNGAGFLINTGINSSGYIKGYILYYKFGSSSSVSSVTLYKINNNVLATDLHFNIESNPKVVDRLSYYSTVEKTILSPSWANIMDIELDISPTTLSVKQGASGSSKTTIMNLDSSVTAGTSISDSGYNGFGPFVQYTGSGHSCNSSSSFKFSNLEMSVAEEASPSASLLAGLKNADYLTDSNTKKFFVNLVGSEYSETASAEDLTYLRILQNNSINIITNYSTTATTPNYISTYMGDNSKNLNILTNTSVSGIETFKIDPMGGATDMDKLAQDIAYYIYSAIYNNSSGQAANTSTTVAKLSLVDKTSTTRQVSQIRRDLILAGGQKVYLDNSGSLNNSTITAIYTIVKPGAGSAVTITPSDDSDSKGAYFLVTNNKTDWPAGEYSVTLSYGEGTLPATTKFSVLEDATAPTVVATSSSGVMNFTITNVEGSGSNAYTTDLDSYVIENTSTAAATTSEWTTPVSIDADATTGSAVITQSGYMHVLVKDIAGNIGQTYIYVSLLFPTITAPVASNINVGQTLADSTLSGGSAVYGETNVPGEFSWVNPTTVPAIGTTTFSAIFTPSPSGIYGSVTTNVAVTVIQPSSGAQKTIKLIEVTSDVLENTNLIEVKANMAGAFRNSVEVKITDVQPTDESIFKIVGGDSEVYPFDISVYNTITKLKVQPNSGYKVKITIPLPEKLWDSRDSVNVVYLNEGKLVTLTSSLVQKQGVWCIVFEADHFSAYALVLNNEPEVVTPGVTPDAIGTMGFEDVSEMNWFYNAVQYISGKGLMAGITKDSFGPTLKTSRAMIVTILYRMEGEPKVTSASGFADVLTGKYYADAVAWGAQNGVVLGYDAQTFRPKENISRQQMAAILYRYATYKGYDVSKTADLGVYPDADNISKWASGNFTWSVAEGLIAGTNNNALDPRGDLTRSQAATTLMRFIENNK